MPTHFYFLTYEEARAEDAKVFDYGEFLGEPAPPVEKDWKFGLCDACDIELCPDLGDSKTRCVTCIRKGFVP